MSDNMFDNRLRPAVEFIPGVVALVFGLVFINTPEQVMPFNPLLIKVMAGIFILFGLYRLRQGSGILTYRKQLKELPRYKMSFEDIPLEINRLFLGRGFEWDRRHTQRIVEADSPDAQKRYLDDGKFKKGLKEWAIKKRDALEMSGKKNSLRYKILSWDSRFNPLRPVPQLGGDMRLHGVGIEDEREVYLNAGARKSHVLALGTTRVGKTRFSEGLITQDIRRGDIVIVIDPKGDKELFMRMYGECDRLKKLDKFHFFHLGYPHISERYNPVGSFSRITEVPSRIASNLPGSGNSAAFKEFAWRFTNIVSRALLGVGERPDLSSIGRYVTKIEPLFIKYHHHWLEAEAVKNRSIADWKTKVVTLQRNIEENEKNLPFSQKGKDKYCLALVKYIENAEIKYDPIAEGLRGIFEYDKTYYDKLTASLLPFIEKLTSGPVGELLSPDYENTDDTRPMLDWMRVIREGGVVYIGLDALTDPEVAGAVGAAMLADLTSVAGRLYKFDETQGLPTETIKSKMPKVQLHCDEFNEVVGPEFIPMLNKAAGAGIQCAAYTQTVEDIESAFENKAMAGQALGNLNTIVMLRVQNEKTAEVLTRKIRKVRVYTKLAESRVTDNNDPDTSIDFVSQNADRFTETEMDMITPADLVKLPVGQAFVLMDGGKLFKIRMPEPVIDAYLPKTVDEVFDGRRRFYNGEAL